MKKYFNKEVCLYCSLVNDAVILSCVYEHISTVGGYGFVIHSISCERYVDCGCTHYGLTPECNTTIKQGLSDARNEIISEAKLL